MPLPKPTIETKTFSKFPKKEVVVEKKPSMAEKELMMRQETEQLIKAMKIEHKAFDGTKKSEQELFCLENLSMSVEDRVLLTNSTFSVESCKRYGLVGLNGTGKTLLVRALALNLFKFPSTFSMAVVEEEAMRDDIKIINCFVSNMEEEDLVEEFKEYAQRSTFKKQTVKIPPSNRMVVLNGLGLTAEKMDWYISALSGGWKMKISLAKALLAQPDLLLLDEPSNMLDSRTVQWLQVYLKEWKKCLIFISHDKGFLDIVATDVISIADKNIKTYACGYSDFLKLREAETVSKREEVDKLKKQRIELTNFIKKFEKVKIEEVKKKKEILANLPDTKGETVDNKEVWRFPACQKIKCATIETIDVCFNYKSNQNILNNISVRIEPDSKICILGDNGCGKTTLLKIFMQILKPTQGNVYVHEKTNVGYFSQHYIDQLDLSKTSLEIMKDRYPTCSEDNSKKNLQKFGITEEDWNRPIQCLSSGQKSRVAFTLIYMKKPNFLIFDEPTSHLDASGTEALEDALRKFKGGVILVTHDGRMMTNVCNDLWYICDRQITAIKDGCVM